MAWRTVVIENSASLSLKDNKLVIANDDEIHVPLEDIDSLILEAPAMRMTKNILLALAENKINVILCDEKYLPTATILPYSQASRGARYAKAQLSLSESTRKHLWRRNIMAKIANQAEVLKKNGYKYEDLIELSKTVRSGDAGNNESIAARLYFARLFEDSTRRKPTWSNSALDYGYAIVRSALARSVASRGFISMVGINHRSDLNQYNLVDDLIESFRPLVDDYIITKVMPKHSDDLTDENLSREDRSILVDILNQSGIISGKKYQIRTLCEMVVDNYANAIINDSAEDFELPKLSL